MRGAGYVGANRHHQVFPERVEFIAQGDAADESSGPDVEIVGDRSTQWYSGASADPPGLYPAAAFARG